MAEKDQARIRELPSMDELNAKDAALDDLLSKLGGSISGRDLAPDESPQASTSGRTPNQMPPSRPPQALRAAAAASWKKSVQSADDQPGRLQSYIIREILKARTAAAAERKELDLEPYIRIAQPLGPQSTAQPVHFILSCGNCTRRILQIQCAVPNMKTSPPRNGDN
ncbi:hypothetical protein VOLCADRAFT_105134 [Volvox carteri f. nagariensis]|uniref:Uncharacterized protein n=1 Tax=Volvox carteri f. nagariensis TaxID=3068 RepID=D8TYK4_VOLCA|nr:uncharacterized protein VOLCADRAFT_105134 [Volvox carteri f. nagariensis]EFJ47410.1 hypothetical protein VOLCADRAFT_105134 [Volvox carteri f. nagariensis]|eukprot:XP_002951599.1 hypothetical protein VOLCADRAFT_105134 [Volvox carteri f. nagariensis]